MKLRILTIVLALVSMLSAIAFEGEIKYRTFRNASPEMLAFQPILFNGENTVTILIKNDKMVLFDERKGTYSIKTSDTLAEYAPADNTGYICPFIDTNAPDMVFPATETTQTREMLGTTITKYICDKNANIGIEMYGWVAKNGLDLPPKVAQIFNNGMTVPGVLTKFTMSLSVPYPMFFCSEIISVTPREVSDSELDVIPSDAQMEIVKDWTKYQFHDKDNETAAKHLKGEMKKALQFGDLVANFMKLHPVTPQKIDKTSYDLDEDWDF